MRPVPSRLIHYFAAAASLCATGIVYFCEIVPLSERNERLEQRLAATQEQRELERNKIELAREREQETAVARAELSDLLGYLPEKSVSVRLPLLTREHFQHFGFQTPVIRLNAVRDEYGLPHSRVAYLGAGVPVGRSTQSVSGLLMAIAEFENQNRFVKVLDVSIGPDALDPRQLMGGFNFSALVRE